MTAVLWALLNSVWQSAVLALAVAAGLRVVSSSAAQRHALWFAVLLASAALPLANLAIPTRSIPVAVPVVQGPATIVHASIVRMHASQAPAYTARARTAGLDASPDLLLLFFTLWALPACGLALRLAAGYVRLRIAKASLVPSAALNASLTSLARGTSPRRVSVGISHLLTEPCVIGFNHPVIVVPASLASSLRKSDLDRVLRHECAHVERYDDYTNLLRQLVRAALFFNPIVHSVARAMALESEIACDDAAALAPPERVEFARCLYEIAHKAKRGRYSPAAGFFGSRRQIVLRVARLLERNHASSARLGFALKGAAALVLLSTLALGSLHLRALAAQREAHATPFHAAGVPSNDTVVTPVLAPNEHPSLNAAPIGLATPSNVTAPVIATAPPKSHRRVQGRSHMPATVAYIAPDSPTHSSGDGDLIDALSDAGYRGLSADDLIELSNHGVTAAFVRELHARGIGPLPARALAELVDHGVTADYIQAMNAQTGAPMKPRDLIRMADSGVSSALVAQMTRFGYRDVSADDYVRMANAGVTPQFVQRILNSGITGARRPSVDELIKLANAGV